MDKIAEVRSNRIKRLANISDGSKRQTLIETADTLGLKLSLATLDHIRQTIHLDSALEPVLGL